MLLLDKRRPWPIRRAREINCEWEAEEKRGRIIEDTRLSRGVNEKNYKLGKELTLKNKNDSQLDFRDENKKEALRVSMKRGRN